MYFTRIEKFNATHKLWIDTRSKDGNLAFLSNSSSKNLCEHNYTMHVTDDEHSDPALVLFMMQRKLGL